jgi:hypothetical protein
MCYSFAKICLELYEVFRKAFSTKMLSHFTLSVLEWKDMGKSQTI